MWELEDTKFGLQPFQHSEPTATISSNGRTLFLVSIPPDATERELVLFFKHAGTIERVVFGNETQAQDEEGEDVVIEDPDGM